MLDWSQNQGTFGAYESANAAFRDTLLPLLRDNDIVWIHDYHLMLLPGMLRSNIDERTNVSMVFFLHIPFPTSQLFRTLSNCAELLASTLCADVIGFHSFDHARHFLTATKRILGVRAHTRPGGLLSLKVNVCKCI
jgi:trehalose 6-phosphate synthase/phosphatase